MKHPLQDKGWQQMNEILDREMPISKKDRKYLIPLFLFVLSIGIGSMLMWPKTKSNSKPINDQEVKDYAYDLGKATASENNATTSNLPAFSKLDSSKANESLMSKEVNSLDSNNKNMNTFQQEKGTSSLIGDISSAKSTSIVSDEISSKPRSSNEMMDLENVKNNDLNAPKDVTSDFDQKSRATLSTAIIPLIKSKLTYNNDYPLNGKIIDVEQISTNNKWDHTIALGIGQNINNLGSRHIWASYSVSKPINVKTHLFGQVGGSWHRVNHDDFVLSRTEINNYGKDNEAFFDSNKDASITVTPSKAIFVDASLGLRRKISSKFSIGAGCTIGYLVNFNYSYDFRSSTATGLQTAVNDLVSNLWNRYYVSPFVEAQYKLTHRWTVVANYSHDLTGLSSVVSNSGQYYFRHARLGVGYKF